MSASRSLPFLRIPPFPGHRGGPLAVADPAVAVSSAEAVAVAAALRRARVGGAFWAPPRPLPVGRDILLAPDNAATARALQDDAASRGEAARCVLIGPYAGRHGIPVIAGLCDPWHLVGGASEVVAGADTELGLVAQLAGTPVRLPGSQPVAEGQDQGDAAATRLLTGWRLRDPFTGRAIDALAAIELLAEWRRLIEANRPLAAIYGVARWKRLTADPLLWDGHDGPRHASASHLALPAGSRAAAWKSRTAADLPET
ncbi:MAG: capsule biosynthesis protein, partial [Sphingomonadales bacterium]|nr:capsule biosynthesis protein [Sphingomonadales bacterium]